MLICPTDYRNSLSPRMSADDEKDVSVHLESAERHDPDESTSAQILLDDIPDGGTVAWLQVLGSYFVFMDTWYDSSPTIFSACIQLALGGS